MITTRRKQKIDLLSLAIWQTSTKQLLLLGVLVMGVMSYNNDEHLRTKNLCILLEILNEIFGEVHP